MKFTDSQENEILEYAVTEIKNGRLVSPFRASVKALQSYLTKNKLMIISEQEYACFVEQQKYIQDGDPKGEALTESLALDAD